jgi:hypothetical protein
MHVSTINGPCQSFPNAHYCRHRAKLICMYDCIIIKFGNLCIVVCSRNQDCACRTKAVVIIIIIIGKNGSCYAITSLRKFCQVCTFRFHLFWFRNKNILRSKVACFTCNHRIRGTRFLYLRPPSRDNVAQLCLRHRAPYTPPSDNVAHMYPRHLAPYTSPM